MIYIPRDATDQQVLDIIHGWVDVLAREDYQGIFKELGLAVHYGEPGPESIRDAIKRYRSPEYFLGIEDFIVTDWRAASGGNSSPRCKVIWFKQNDIGGAGLRGAVSFDLPMNGKWSDLTADFVFFENEDKSKGYPLALEEIRSNSQWQREMKDLEK